MGAAEEGAMSAAITDTTARRRAAADLQKCTIFVGGGLVDGNGPGSKRRREGVDGVGDGRLGR